MSGRKILLAFSVIMTGANCFAASDDALLRCASINSPIDRLTCYDKLVASIKPVAAPAAETPDSIASVVAPEPVEVPVATPVPAAVVPVAAPPEEPAPESESEDFGFENQRIEKTPDTIQSRYDGTFTGWTGKTMFRLENGQVWQQSESGRFSYRRERPMIIIKKKTFGSFVLKVEGLNRSIRVKRIK